MGWAFWLWVALSVLGALLFAALVWFGGPLISVADYPPLEGAGVRLTIIAVVFLIVGGLVAWRIITRRRAAAALAKAMTEAAQDDSDAPVLKQKMEDALATLRNSKTGGARALRSAMVSHHRAAGRRQDHGAGQFRPALSARVRRRPARRSPASAARAIATGGSPTRRC